MVSKPQRTGNNILFYFALFVGLNVCVLTAGCASLRTNAPYGKGIKQIPPAPVMYHEAINLVNGTKDVPPNYTAAIEKFKEFKASYPANPRTAEADSWIRILEKLQTLKKMGLEDIGK